MTGMRGNPCPDLYAILHYQSGVITPYCAHQKNDGKVRMGVEKTELCPIGAWCPLVGDPEHHVVKARRIRRRK